RVCVAPHAARAARRAGRGLPYGGVKSRRPVAGRAPAALVGALPGPRAPARARATATPGRAPRGQPAGPPAPRPQDVALLRAVRRPGGPLAAPRQLPGGPGRARRPAHVADERGPDAPLDARGARLRLRRPPRAR